MMVFIHRSRVLFAVFVAVFAVFATILPAQKVVDKTVATVSDGVRTELILYSDLMWQLAMQPNVPLTPPRSEDLQRALDIVVDQRLFALEAERLPRTAPTEDEIDTEIKLTLARFASANAFVERLRTVGFSSIKDDDFERLISRRLAIEKYTDFRFRSFVVVSKDEEDRYYNTVFVPDFRKRYAGLVVPTLKEKRDEIHSILVEDKVAARIETFLDDAKRRNDIEILIEP